MFIPRINISIAEPFDVQIDELGNNSIQLYQFVGDIGDTKVPGSERIPNYMNEYLFSKNESASNEHHYRITNKLYNEDIHNL